MVAAPPRVETRANTCGVPLLNTMNSPRPTSRWREHVTEGLNRAVGQIDPLHFAASKESDRTAIRRPERHQHIVSPDQRPRLKRIEASQPELCPLGLIGGDESELSAVWRKRSAAGAIRSSDAACGTEETILRRIDLKSHDLCWSRSCHQAIRENTRERGDENPPRYSFTSEKSGPRRHGNGCFSDRLVEIEARIGDIVDASLGIFLQAALQYSPNRWRGVCRQRAPVRFALQDAGQRVRYFVAVERAPAGQHLVEHSAKGPHIAALVGWLATCLLWTHVGGGAEDHADLRGCRTGDGWQGRTQAGPLAAAA